jgi:hypothetical protein
MVNTPEFTEVEKAFATSLAPMPYASQRLRAQGGGVGRCGWGEGFSAVRTGKNDRGVGEKEGGGGLTAWEGGGEGRGGRGELAGGPGWERPGRGAIPTLEPPTHPKNTPKASKCAELNFAGDCCRMRSAISWGISPPGVPPGRGGPAPFSFFFFFFFFFFFVCLWTVRHHGVESPPG